MAIMTHTDHLPRRRNPFGSLLNTEVPRVGVPPPVKDMGLLDPISFFFFFSFFLLLLLLPLLLLLLLLL